METGMRNFSARRLYKLATLLVIVISILSGIVAYTNYRAVKHYSQRITRFYEEHPKGDLLYEHTYDITIIDRLQQGAIHRCELLIAIAIGLPVVFFGGIGLYKYLFPIQKE